MRRALEKTGLSNPLVVVRDGKEAVDYLDSQGPFADRERYPLPGLLLLDLKMPRMDGFDVLDWLLTHPELDDIAVVILSSSNLESDIEKAKELGADDYRVKSLGTQDLVVILQELNACWLAGELIRPA